MTPHIIISSADLDGLEALAGSLPSHAAMRAALLHELDRAEIVEPQALPPDVVAMRSTVRFTIGASAEEHCLTLVYPAEADGHADRISVLTPVGSALLGLGKGDTIAWDVPAGGQVRLTVRDVAHGDAP